MHPYSRQTIPVLWACHAVASNDSNTKSRQNGGDENQNSWEWAAGFGEFWQMGGEQKEKSKKWTADLDKFSQVQNMGRDQNRQVWN